MSGAGSTERVPLHPPHAPRTRPRRAGRLRAFVVIVLVLAAAGIAVGVAWSMLSPSVTAVMTPEGPVPLTEEAAGQLAAMDSWYAVLGGVTGVVLGAALATVFLRRGAAMVLALVVGGCLAAALAVVAGSLFANHGVILAWHPHDPVRTTLTEPLMLHARGYLLVWPIAVLAPVIPLTWFGWREPEQSGADSGIRVRFSTDRPTQT